MRIISSTAVIAAATLFAAPALAQTAPAPPAPTTTPATPAAPVAAAPVTDAEVTAFVSAVIAVEAITKDPAIAEADKQPKMAARIKELGLEPARFNEIAQGLQADPALKTRVQAEMAKQKPAAPAAQ